MTILIVFGVLMLVALLAVSSIHQMQKKEEARRIQQRRIRIQIGELTDLLNCIEQTVGDKMLAQKINYLIIGLLQTLSRLDPKPSPHLNNALQIATDHAKELNAPNFHLRIKYERESDAQIKKAQQQLVDAIALLSNMTTQGKITEQEFSSYNLELRWAHLMVSVASLCAQGRKCLLSQDRVTSSAFYQRALQQLIESPHPNPKRNQLIREINEILEGNRTDFTPELLQADQLTYETDMEMDYE